MTDVEKVDHRLVYADRADDYDLLVSAEDADGHLLPAIGAHVQLAGARVLEIGVGTGRITELLVASGARVVGCEPSPGMLEVARRNLERFPDHGCELHLASVQDFTPPGGDFALAIAGWVLGHFVEWFAPAWRDEIGRALDRMLAALAPGGVLMIIETLGTGFTEPTPPTPGLAEYHDWLERDRGMERTALRTDYVFPDVETAASTCGAFFGQDFAARVRREKWARVPECTGMWVRRA
ncbi:MAG TPA: class I SAM-dependent methyltransferase [Kofleriaceae bacterium]|nr:class I SAM-dependent methyltransferase [Kofleriaceae bacterium]